MLCAVRLFLQGDCLENHAEQCGAMLDFMVGIKECLIAPVSPLAEDGSVSEGAVAGFAQYLSGLRL